jgi:putative hydrolase of the HAD superfamily
MNSFKHIFFDLDHTIWDFDKNSKFTFKKIFQLNNINLDIDVFLEAYLPINTSYWKLYRANNISKQDLRFGRLKDTFKSIDLNISTKLIHKLSEDYIKFLSTFNFLIEDSLKVLEYLNKKYTLHIITNGFQEVQNEKLLNSNIYHFFSTITNSEMVGVKKPNKKIFQVALDKANANKTNSIMIGDNLDADVIGALKFGMSSILFNYHKEDVPADIDSIDKLDELIKLF